MKGLIPAALLFLVFGGLLRGSTLTFERSISLGEVKGRIDHFGFDAKGERLFVAALGNDTVEVVDLKRGKVVHSISGLSEPQGLLYVPEFNRLYVANGGDGALRVYDGAAFAEIATVKFDDDADNVRYDEAAKQVYVGYGSGALGIVDAAKNELAGSIAVEAHPESFQLEKGSARIFINEPGAHAIAVADRNSKGISVSWRPTASSNFPMALDEADHRLIVGCRSPARLIVIDTESGKEVAALDLHRDCDDVFFDAMRKQIYASCGEGFIDVFTQSGADRYVLKEAVKTEARARTCYFSEDRLYLAVPRHGDQPPEIRVFRIAK